MRCPHCGARMDLRQNPFYGVGLAVHERIAGCPECEYVEYVPLVHPEEPPTDDPPKRSILRIIRSAVGGRRT